MIRENPTSLAIQSLNMLRLKPWLAIMNEYVEFDISELSRDVNLASIMKLWLC